jgi:hypothetical protein
MSVAPALVQPIPFASKEAIEKRKTARHVCGRDAVSHPLDGQDTLCWGAQVRDISAGGIGLSLCYPFKLGTLLAIDIQGPPGGTRTLLARVVRVNDQVDGTWTIGCEFVKPISDSDVEILV